MRFKNIIICTLLLISKVASAGDWQTLENEMEEMAFESIEEMRQFRDRIRAEIMATSLSDSENRENLNRIYRRMDYAILAFEKTGKVTSQINWQGHVEEKGYLVSGKYDVAPTFGNDEARREFWEKKIARDPGPCSRIFNRTPNMLSPDSEAPKRRINYSSNRHS